VVRSRGTDDSICARDAITHAMRVDDATLNAREVGQITHNSISFAEKSCEQILLRVKSDPLFSCSIRLFNRRRSTTELTTDPHSRQVNAEDNAPKQIETLQSCGLAPSEEIRLTTRRSSKLSTEHPNAGQRPAFFLRAPSAFASRARRAEFISVSGQCAARSALSSDMRIKRISGGVAATEHLRAPMNSPAGGFAAHRVSFST
jgi:hypothetical protein